MTGDVAIIGAGHVGITLLVDLLDATTKHSLSPVLLTMGPGDKCDRLTGEYALHELLRDRRCRVRVDSRHVAGFESPSGQASLAKASHIVIAVPDIPALRLRLLERILERTSVAGKTLVLVRGGQGGQPVIAGLARTDPRLSRASIVLVEDSFYGTRVADRSVTFKRKFDVNIAIYCADGPDIALGNLRKLFPLGADIGRESWPDFSVRRGIELLFDPLGYYIHVGVALHPQNLERTAAGIQYTHYIDGIDRELAATLDKLDQERVRLAAAYGVESETFPEILQRQYGIPRQVDFYNTMQSCREIYRSRSCSSLDDLRRSRLINEDVPALLTIEWLMSLAGLEMPATHELGSFVRRQLDCLGIEIGMMSGYVNVLRGHPHTRDSVERLLDDPFYGSPVDVHAPPLPMLLPSYRPQR